MGGGARSRAKGAREFEECHDRGGSGDGLPGGGEQLPVGQLVHGVLAAAVVLVTGGALFSCSRARRRRSLRSAVSSLRRASPTRWAASPAPAGSGGNAGRRAAGIQEGVPAQVRVGARRPCAS